MNENQKAAKKAYDQHLKQAFKHLKEIEAAMYNLPNSDINWANVGDAAHLEEQLKAISDSLLRRGEFAR